MASGDARDLGRLPGFLAAVGLLLSAILEWVHIQTNVFPAADSYCSMGERMDCAAVAASPYAVVLGLPLAALGLFGFVALFVASRLRSAWLLPLSGLAAAFSVALFVLSAAALGTFCLLCEAVHLLAVVLFVVTWKRRKSLTVAYSDRPALLGVLVFPALLALATWVSIPRYWAAFSYKAEPPLPVGLTPEGDPWIGSPSPQHVVDEYTDYQCPHCKVAAARSLRLLASHPDVRLVRHPNSRMRCRAGTTACLTARLAVCAGDQGRFWQADRYLFAHADARKGVNVGAFAEAVRVDRAALDRCLASDSAYQRAERAYLSARKSHVVDTPGYLVDGKKVAIDELPNRLR